ncbi:hypothetical protein LCGC14_0297750 [marine sediment metagenome]|uniref:Uncharacterized protein n=1 Tax=marine sediment metagenome TaxID=412755 RepID=A0A0F9WCI2_9ZZZZ
MKGLTVKNECPLCGAARCPASNECECGSVFPDYGFGLLDVPIYESKQCLRNQLEQATGASG